MRILMLGGTALTGPHVARQLQGHDLWTLSRRGWQVAHATAVIGDREKSADIGDSLQTARPDLIIDMVPFTVQGAQALVDALTTYGHAVPVIALSSIDVYAGYGRLHGTEETAFQPVPFKENATLRQHYGPEGAAYDKIGVEELYAASLPDLTILRMPAIYGWPDATRIAPYLDPMLRGDAHIEMAEDVMSFQISRILHKNAAHAVVCAVRTPPDGQRIFNVAELQAHTEAEWLHLIARHVGWNGHIKAAPKRWDGGPLQSLAGDSTAIRDTLGFTEVYDPHDGLADAIDHYIYSRRGIAYEKGY